MATIAAPQSTLHEKFAKGPGLIGSLIFVAVLIAGVITTHVLSSGGAGTMMANRSGLQWSTARN